MSFNQIKRNRIYKHTELNQQDADRLKPLMESAFKNEFSRYTGRRKDIAEERLRFVTEQYANRVRIAKNMGASPLFEDANIFGQTMPQLKSLFESSSLPGNVIGMGEVSNPDSSNQYAGGIWNAGYKPGSGDVPSYVFGLQNHIALNCIGFDLLPTIAVDTPKVVVTYIDTVYGGGTFDDKDNLPSFIELTSPVFTRTWIKAKTLVRATSEVITVAADGKAMKTRFMVGSTVKAALTAEVLATGTAVLPAKATLTAQGIVITSKLTGTAGNAYRFTVVDSTSGGLAFTEVAGSLIVDLGGATPTRQQVVTLLAASTLFDVTLGTAGNCIVASILPLTGGLNYTFTWNNSVTVKQVVDAVNASVGAYVFGAAPTTEVTGTAITLIGVDYASATRTNIAEAASNNNSIGGMTRAQHEKGPKHKLNVIAMDKQLEMVGLEIDADTSNIQIKDMAAMGVNVISHLYTGVQNQLVQSLDETILDHLYRLGVTHAVNVYQSQGVNYSLYIDTPTNATKAMSTVDVEFKDILGNDRRSDMGNITNSLVSAAHENQMTHADRLYARILLVAEFVGQQNRIAPPDTMVIGGTIASTLKKNSTFAACPVTTTLSNKPELHYTGTIFETINVYKNPKIDFSDPRILLSRRGNDSDPGAKFLAYDLAASRQIVAEGTMSEKIRVWSRFAIADIGFYPELNYYTFVVLNGYNWA